MKHQPLSTYICLYKVCREGGGEVYHNVETQPLHRLQIRELTDFFLQLEEHGYDILSPSDAKYTQVVSAFNEVMKRSAIKDNLSSYDHFQPETISTCGRWIFLDHYPYSSEKEEVEMDDHPKRGGAREGAGRKSKHDTLMYKRTAVIRVPEMEKDRIQQLIKWLIEKEGSQGSVFEALRSAQYALESKAENLKEREHLADMAQDYQRQAELLRELESLLPHFGVVPSSRQHHGDDIDVS